MDTLSIGQLAKACDENIQTVRYYERRGCYRGQTGGCQVTVSIRQTMLVASDSSNALKSWASP
ncbi:MAG: hypothetical protein O3B01_27650 [Planctomycetota bacterium]|nr:hypothetical protein [Planctomycetota bacterium]